MTDPVKPRRKVTAQIPISASSPTPYSSVTLTRPRARVNPSSLATPPASERPSLRSTPSSVSLRSDVGSGSRARSAATTPELQYLPRARLTHHGTASASSPGVASASLRSSEEHTPTTTMKIRSTISKAAGSASRAESSGVRSVGKASGEPGPGPSSAGLAAKSRPPSRAAEGFRATVRAPPVTPTSGNLRARALSNVSTHAAGGLLPSPQPSPLLSPSTIDPVLRPEVLGTLVRLSDQVNDGGSSNRSSPSRTTVPLPSGPLAHLAISLAPHLTASCPPSPHHATYSTMPDPPLSAGRVAHRRPPLPFNPYTHHPPPLPPPPLSPEVRTIALPPLTPARSSDEDSSPGSRRVSLSGSEVSEAGTSLLPRVAVRPERDRLSGSTVVEEDLGDGKDLQGGGSDAVLEKEEARRNRRVADLEISNASLLAINRSLEGELPTKAKQRAEIIKLRRALRESLNGIKPSLTQPAVGGHNSSLHSALAFLSPSAEPYAEDPDYFSDEAISDPQLDARWDKVTGMLEGMLRTGEEAVVRLKEDIKPEGARVLTWVEVEGDAHGSGPGTGLSTAGTPERSGADSSPVGHVDQTD